MNFEKILKKFEVLGQRINDTPERVFEFEFYSIMFHLLDVLHAFETEARKPLRAFDYYELLGKLEFNYKTLKGNIKYLEKYRK